MSEFAFDRVATEYDVDFTDTDLAHELRQAVWSRLAQYFKRGMHVLELGCGTGEDALWLAKNGVRVTATDVSQAMLDVTRHKVAQAGVADFVETFVLDAAAPRSGVTSARFGERTQAFDGAFANFGGLNCVENLAPLAQALAGWIKPHGHLVLVLMNRWCAWEIVWHLLHLQPRVAFRRMRRGGVEARVGGGIVRTWYPSIGSIRRVFSPSFEVKRVIGLGVFLPPSYLERIVAKRPRLFQTLIGLERATAKVSPFSNLADHVIIEFNRLRMGE